MNLFWPSLFWLLAWFAPLGVFSLGLYWLFTLPLRRQERARFFLDLLETGFRQGHSPETTIAAISATHDRSVGVRFHLLAAHLQSGLLFTDALARVPSMASPQVAAILRVGEKLGDVRKVFPVCRGMLKDANSQMRNAVNYLLLLVLVGTPIVPLLLATLRELVIPRLQSVVAEPFGVDPHPPGMMGVIDLSNWIAAAQVIFAVLIVLGVAAYIGGPRLRRWVATVFPIRCDRLMYRVPWRRKRLRRDFAAMLAMLLDAGVPEATSIQLAAAATANHVFLQHAELAVRDLQSGLNLPTALRRFDREAEFSWRLTNAAHGPNGFAAALSGWMESLDAKAFQQEQTFSQIVSTGLVLVSGLLVGLVVYGVFHILVSVTNEAILW
jgi:type II secretory pathway component PulF